MSLKLYQQYRNLNNVLNNTYCDDDGKAIYKVHTPITFLKQSTTTITKSLYNRPAVSTVPPADDLGNTTPPETGLDSEETDVQSLASGIQQRRSTSIHESDFEVQKDTGLGVKAGGSDPEVDGASPHGSSDDDDQKNSLNFEYIAQIDWSVVLSSKIRFGQGRFTGQEVLVTKLFRRVGWGWLGRHRAFTGEDGKEYKWRMGHSRPELTLNDETKTLVVASFHPKTFTKGRPYLEIFPEGQHMVDEIFITFTYIERLRKTKERAARSS